MADQQGRPADKTAYREDRERRRAETLAEIEAEYGDGAAVRI